MCLPVVMFREHHIETWVLLIPAVSWQAGCVTVYFSRTTVCNFQYGIVEENKYGPDISVFCVP
jgi:hypothetical protein